MSYSRKQSTQRKCLEQFLHGHLPVFQYSFVLHHGPVQLWSISMKVSSCQLPSTPHCWWWFSSYCGIFCRRYFLWSPFYHGCWEFPAFFSLFLCFPAILFKVSTLCFFFSLSNCLSCWIHFSSSFPSPQLLTYYPFLFSLILLSICLLSAA